MLAIVDYGVGNLFSLRSSCAAVGHEAVVTGNPAILAQADRIILPGVGAFGDAARKLEEAGLKDFLLGQAKSGKPLLGICLGMQLLFEESEEFGRHRGLGLVPGRVVAMEGMLPRELKIPHIGWNALHFTGIPSPLLQGIANGDHVYFVHSYHAVGCGANTIATAEYGREVTAAVQCGNVFGTQFHPEKSGPTGLRLLRNFCEWRADA